MMSVKTRTAMLVCIVVLSVGGPALAAPVITAFSSTVTSGTATNKANDQDLMYLMTQGGAVTFQVTTTGAEAYEWQVNKAVQAGATGNSLAWTVPNEKGVWEIHLKVTGGGAEVHQEWVISTRPTAEAPFFFDFFTDRKYKLRGEADPWGRNLPEWKTWRDDPMDASDGLLKVPGRPYAIAKGRMKHGTWIYRHRVHTSTFLDWSMGVWSSGGSNGIGYRYFSGGTGTTTWQPNVELAPTHWTRNEVWVTGKVIRTADGWIYWFLNDDLVPQSIGQKDDQEEKPKVYKMFPFPDGLEDDEFGMDSSGVDIDGLEFYKDKYLWPAKKIEYAEYINRFDGGSTPSGTRNGIVMAGRDIRLADIADAIDNHSLFTYNEDTKTAICQTDLVITGGAELVLDGETLKMLGSDSNEWQIKLNNGATIKLNKAVIESGNSHPYWWNFTSELDYWIYKAGQAHPGGESLTSFAGRFVAKDSVIKDSGWIILHGATQIDLQGVKFVNMHNADKGSYAGDHSRLRLYKPYFGGEWTFQLNNRIPLQGDFNLRGLTFSGANGTKATVCLIGSDHLGKTNIYDSDFSEAVIHAKKHNRWFGWYSSPPASDNILSYFNGTINLINCKPGEIVVDTDRAFVIPKYYLDVKVVDTSGKPVVDAMVSVTNEIDDVNYPSENLQEMWDLTEYFAEGVLWALERWYKKFIDINNNTRPEKLAESLMAMKDIGDCHREITNIQKDAADRITQFTESYTHYYADPTVVSYVYDFTYDEDGRLSGYTKTRNLSEPIGSARDLVFQYDLEYNTEGGKVIDYTISKKTTEHLKYVDRCLQREWCVSLCVKTDAAGHIPGPADTVHTIVLSDFVQDNEGQTEFTYAITVKKGEHEKTVTGINPNSTWYRPDAETPTRTVVIVLDGDVAVCNRRVFYNNSAFDGENAAANANDDGSIAPDKTVLLPGGTAKFANYTSYSRGINGIMIDVVGLPGTPTAADFTFKVGNDNTPASWANAPAPTSITVREGAGLGGSDRITIIWADNAIQKQWLQVTVKATTATGLVSDDVFYFGNAVGETGNSATDATVKPTDEIGARNNPHTLGGTPAGIDDAYDFDRDKKVGPTDEIIARNNGTNSSTALKLIMTP